MMRAIEIRAPGGPEQLTQTMRPVPRPSTGEVLIRVEAAGVNRPDVLQRRGRYAPPPGASDLPGLEVAGTVAALGDGAEGFAAGDRVCALLSGGGYAEYAVADAGSCLPVPAGLSMVEAASLPETMLTVWTNLVDGGRMQAGETVLIHGGTSGIGVAAIQLAKALGATVVATAGSAAKVAACLDLGADRAVNYREEDFVEAVLCFTAGRGADVTLDMVGGDYVARDMAAAATGGRIVVIAFQNGSTVPLDLPSLMRKRLVLTGSFLRSRTAAEKGAIAQAVRRTVWPLIAAGRIRPVVSDVLPLADAARAHARMESSVHIGKIVLEVASAP
jgi:putative PIG3 family NAD(P)H quinone oxidoreductase